VPESTTLQHSEAGSTPAAVMGHGSKVLPAVTVDTYNEELREAEGFVGDRASGRAFRAILDDWRKRLAEMGEDPFGDTPTREISKAKLDKMLAASDAMAAGLVHTAVEEFAQELATVVRRFMELETWAGTERIVVGGGLSFSHIGELAVGRAGVLTADHGLKVDFRTIANHPDEAGLIGAVHLAPGWVLAGHDAVLAVDIGGTNIRAGVVELKMKKKSDVSKAGVWKSEHWRHRDEKPTRKEAVRRVGDMLGSLIESAAKEKLKLAPFVGVGCPGLIDERGTILTGGQNLPGNWEGDGFNLAESLGELLPKIDGHRPAVIMHNDAVVQGLSEIPNMTDVSHWGVLTIGTGLGNARFTNRDED
jgi:predicted NBD/HSP70 family sugar kinase